MLLCVCQLKKGGGEGVDKKENKIFLIYKENSEDSGCKVIHEEGLPNI
jgi:hypothetical protein